MTPQRRTVESVRLANLSGVLGIVHREGPQSRAVLTELTGLNRSTVADLVSTLVEFGLVSERAPDPSRRVGRPSPIVAAAPDVVAVAVNPEVDGIEMAAVGLDQSIRAAATLPQHELLTADGVAALVATRIDRWRSSELSDARIVGVGLAVPGLVRAGDGLVRDAPHLRWTDTPLRDIVAEATAMRVVIGNDATLGATAEHLFGAARGIDDALYLNGGASGIGGGIIIGGRPVVGSGGFAGEFGQNRPGIADPDDRRVPHGVLEDEVSRARLLTAAGLERADDRQLAAALAPAARSAGTPLGDGPRDEHAARIADETDRQRRILATALSNAVNVLNPSVVVLGGFLAILADLDAAGFEALVRAQSMAASGEHVRIVPAALAENRLLIGAAEAVFDGILSHPTALA